MNQNKPNGNKPPQRTQKMDMDFNNNMCNDLAYMISRIQEYYKFSTIEAFARLAEMYGLTVAFQAKKNPSVKADRAALITIEMFTRGYSNQIFMMEQQEQNILKPK